MCAVVIYTMFAHFKISYYVFYTLYNVHPCSVAA